MLIKGKKTYLDAFQEQDAQIIQDWMNQFELRRLAWTECDWPATLEEARNWIQSLHQSERTSLLALRELHSDELIGFFTVKNISWISRSLRFGSLIWPPAYWNQGLGTDARKAFLDYAFNYLGIQRVYGFFADYNIASQRSHEKLGAQVTATNCDAVYMDGRYYDAHYYVYCQETFVGNLQSALPVREDNFGIEDLQRTYSDFYGVPESEEKFQAWFHNQKVIHKEAGDLVLLIDPIKRSGDLLFFLHDPEKLASLIDLAVDKAANTYNLHRIQVCLPSSAIHWREALIKKGFGDEGRLSAIIYSNGSYLDLCFLGMIFGVER